MRRDRIETYYSNMFGSANVRMSDDSSDFIYDDGWGKKSRAQRNEDFVFRDGLAFPIAFSCSNYRTPAESPYGYGPHIVTGPVKVFKGDKIQCDYDDRLRQFYPDKWSEACGLLGKDRLKNASLGKVSKFLSCLYGYEVKALQVIEGCNASNGYPYLIFVSERRDNAEPATIASPEQPS